MSTTLHKENTRDLGFTLIELMLSIAIIAILTGVTVTILDPVRQRNYGREASDKANLEKACLAIEAYYQGEGSYPPEGAEPSKSPLTGDASDAVSLYISSWPGDDFIYSLADDGNSFSIHVQKRTDATSYYKCTNLWGSIDECTNVSSVSSCN